VIASDFGFHGNSAGNRLLSFRDHGPGRDAAGTTRTERAHAGPVRRRGAPVSHLAAAARTPAMVIDAQGARELRGARHGSSGGPSSGRPLRGISCELDPVTAVAGDRGYPHAAFGPVQAVCWAGPKSARGHSSPGTTASRTPLAPETAAIADTFAPATTAIADTRRPGTAAIGGSRTTSAPGRQQSSNYAQYCHISR
jgi:hypothetical protein